MKAGDIIFVDRGTDWLSRVMKIYDPGPFTHVCIAISDEEIFEAQYYTRATIVPMHYKDYVTVPLNLTDKEAAKLGVLCEELEGKWYDYIQILGYVMKYYFGSNVDEFNNPNHLICSEAIGLILYLLDKIDNPLHNVTPNQLYEILRGAKGDGGQ